MGLRGPAPKPTRLAELQGNPGKRPLNTAEPRPPVGMPERPRWLQGAARRLWDDLAPRLAAAGLLTAIDANILALYCSAFARWRDAERLLRDTGPVILTDKGNQIQAPALSIANAAMHQMLVYGRELGLSPAARSRINLPDAAPAGSLADDLFAAAAALMDDPELGPQGGE